MASQLSEQALELGRKAYLLAMAHGAESAAQTLAATNEANSRFAELYDRPRDSTSPEDDDSYLKLRDMAVESWAIRNPGFQKELQELRQHQASVEDRLGKLIANSPPPFILEALGPAPKTSGTTHPLLIDTRWWAADLGPDQAMTPRQYWQRVAGAYAAVIAGQHQGDPELFDFETHYDETPAFGVIGEANAQARVDVLTLLSDSATAIKAARQPDFSI